MKKRLLGFALCGLIIVSSMSANACVKRKIDDDAGDKSVLYVTNYNGGFGKEWIAEVEKRFEAKYENEHFETGKTGVLSLRFAGFPVVGLNTGNISKSGLDGFCYKKVDNLMEILEVL